MLGLDEAQVGRGAVIQPIEVAQEADIVRWGGTASSPSSCCANRYFYFNLCTIRIEIGAVLAIIAQEPSPSLS